MPKPRAWHCWSSGKDSAWALHVVRQQNEIEVVRLLTTVTGPYDRVSMHGVRVELLEAQAEAVGIPLHQVAIPAPCPDEVYREAMRQAVEEAKRQGVTQMVFGDLYLEDVRAYREKQLEGTGIAPVFPLWGRPTAELARAMIAAGLVAHVTCLDPKKIPRGLAGHRFDEAFLARLPEGVDPCAENGEFHTCASAGPMFRHPIPVALGETVQRDGFVFTDLALEAGRARQAS
jgi:uncharacterized protein (TIGR00290 family)